MPDPPTYRPSQPGFDHQPNSAASEILVHPRRHQGRLVLALVGEADVSTADALRNQLVAALAFSPVSITVDCAGLTFCGLAGLDALHAFQLAAGAGNVPVQLRRMTRQLSWLNRTFPLRPAATVGQPRPVGPAYPEQDSSAPTGSRNDARRDMIRITPTGLEENG